MTEEQLQKLIVQYRVPVHVQKHMKKVAAVALYLGQKIRQAGEVVDLITLRQAALLHDILKICDFKSMNFDRFEQNVTAEDIHFWTALNKSCSHIGHTEAGYNILKELGEDTIAVIVRRHRFDSLTDERDKPDTWEEKLLYYADKRVRHDQITSIAERLADGRRRYFPDGVLPENDHLVEKALYVLQDKICGKAGIKPEDITEQSVEIYLEK